MKRKSTRDEDVSHEAILKAAERIFGEKGFHASSIEQIARAAKVGKGTVFLHFKRKENLFFALVENRFAAMDRRYDEIVGTGRPAAEKLRAVADVAGWLQGDLPKFSRAVISGLRGLSPTLRKRLDTLMERTYKLYHRRFTALFKEALGDVRPKDIKAQALSTLFLACMDGLLVRARAAKLTPSRQDIGNACKFLFLDALRAGCRERHRPDQ